MSTMGKKGLSKALAASGVISTAGYTAIIHAITLIVGTTDSSIIIKNGGTSGTEMWKLAWNGQTAAGDACVHATFPGGLVCSTDAYGTLAGTDAAAYIQYDEIEV